MNTIEILKGVHPGLFLSRELKKRGLKSKDFAVTVDEHPQTLSAIIRGRRGMNTSLSLHIENALGLDEGMLMTLQVFYDIEKEKKLNSQKSGINISIFRKALFWDTSFDKIDWLSNKTFVINRVFSRGNESEINEVIRYYGKDSILPLLDLNNSYSPNIKQNAINYLNSEL